MRRFVVLLGALPLMGGCADDRVAGESDVACIHRLYDYPNRAVPFAAAADTCAGGHRLDLTGDAVFQEKARTANIPFVSRDRHGLSVVQTGSLLVQPADQPAPPELHLR